MDNNPYFDCDSISWKEIMNTKINFSFNDKKEFFGRSNFVTFYVKDMNYNQISEISTTAVADIKNFGESIDFLVKNNFQVVRIGDSLSKEFEYKNDSYFDLIKTKHLNLINQYKAFEKCQFFFGTSTPSIATSIFFDKKRVITNVPAQYSNNSVSFSKENFSIFKKVFCLKQMKILSIEEILNDENLFIEETSILTNTNNKNYILIENSKSEILETCRNFIDYNFRNIKQDETLLNQYLDQRSLIIERLFKTSSVLTKNSSIKKYRYSQVSIPNFFLKKYLYNSKELIEESKIFAKKINKNNI